MSPTTTEHVTRSFCRGPFSPLACHGDLQVESFLSEVRIEYVAWGFSIDRRDATFVKLCWEKNGRELWICQLQVATPFRRQGLGKKLVSASEQLARQLAVRTIHVFPLQPARRFWAALGFQPDANISRVLTKQVAAQRAVPMAWSLR